jgi:TRAP-type mannitol/chloroaromatic compound transport system substrate-binding protein
MDEVYERFKYAMDNILTIPETTLAAFAKAFPKEFDKAKELYGKGFRNVSYTEKVLSQKLGVKRVKIIGGDDMVSEDDILNRPFVEVHGLKKR